MKTFNFKIVMSMLAIGISTSAFSATPVLMNPIKINPVIRPVLPETFRLPFIQQVNPIIANQFSRASKDYKTFHGSMCQPYQGNQQGDFQHRDNGFYNKSNQTRTVVCPLVRDNVNKTNGVWASIYVNNPANKIFSCWLDSRGKYGNVINWVNKKTSNSGNQTLKIDVYKMVKDGNFNLYCSVPAKGRIASYKIGENLRTDSNN